MKLAPLLTHLKEEGITLPQLEENIEELVYDFDLSTLTGYPEGYSWRTVLAYRLDTMELVKYDIGFNESLHPDDAEKEIAIYVDDHRGGFAHNCYDCPFSVSKEEFLERNGNLDAWTETRGCCEVDQIRENIEENLHDVLTDIAYFEKENLRLNKIEL